MKRTFLLNLVLFVTPLSVAAAAGPSGNPVVPDGQLGEFRHGTYPSFGIGDGDWTHVGVDLTAPCGTRVYAFADGKVIDVVDSKDDKNFSSLGYMVLIEHPPALLDRPSYSIYLHFQEPPAVAKDVIVQGGTTLIGRMGSTGAAIGCNTHFEVRYFPGRFQPDWNNIYGRGDQRQSQIFKDNWADPEVLFRKYPKGLTSVAVAGPAPSTAASQPAPANTALLSNAAPSTAQPRANVGNDAVVPGTVRAPPDQPPAPLGPVGHGSLYDRQSGLWAAPNCEAATAYFYAAGDTYLSWVRGDRGWTTFLNHPVASRMTESHIIEEYKYGDVYAIYYSWFDGDKLMNASPPAEQYGKTQQNIATVSTAVPRSYQIAAYSRCGYLPADMLFAHAEGIKFMQLAAGIREKCVAQAMDDCMNFIFSFVDVSKDRKLSVAEISRMIRIAAYASIAANPEGASEEGLSGALALATLFGPWVASSIIEGSDYNADGQLGLDEIFYDRDLIGVKAAIDKMSLDVVGSPVGAVFHGMGRLPGLF